MYELNFFSFKPLVSMVNVCYKYTSKKIVKSTILVADFILVYNKKGKTPLLKKRLKPLYSWYCFFKFVTPKNCFGIELLNIKIMKLVLRSACLLLGFIIFVTIALILIDIFSN